MVLESIREENQHLQCCYRIGTIRTLLTKRTQPSSPPHDRIMKDCNRGDGVNVCISQNPIKLTATVQRISYILFGQRSTMDLSSHQSKPRDQAAFSVLLKPRPFKCVSLFRPTERLLV